jgi:hypothetical protein
MYREGFRLGGAMRQIRISVVVLMVLAAAVAVDLAVLRTISSVTILSTRIGLFGALPMANVLAVYLVFVLSGLSHRGEIALSRFAFLLVGEVAILLVVYVSILAPRLLFDYIELTAGPLQSLMLTDDEKLAIAQGSRLPPLYSFGIGRTNLVQVFLATAAVTPLLLIPSFAAALATRGDRLKLLKRDEVEGS